MDIEPPKRRLEGVEHHTLDVREPIPEALGQGADVIYNLAAVHRTPGHPDADYFRTNVAGAINAVGLAEACAIRTMVFTSSISVYGPCEEPIFETSPQRPVTAYGESKRLAERIHQQWRGQAPDRRLIITRPGVVFGPGEAGNYTQLARALKGGYFAFPGRRDTVKSGGSVEELLLTIDFALAYPAAETVYNFAYPRHSTTAEIVDIMRELIGGPARPITLPLPLLMTVALAFEAAGRLGLKTAIHRDRVMKLVQSTKIEPQWLLANGYQFSTDIKSALAAWGAATEGRFE